MRKKWIAIHSLGCSHHELATSATSSVRRLTRAHGEFATFAALPTILPSTSAPSSGCSTRALDQPVAFPSMVLRNEGWSLGTASLVPPRLLPFPGTVPPTVPSGCLLPPQTVQTRSLRSFGGVGSDGPRVFVVETTVGLRVAAFKKRQ